MINACTHILYIIMFLELILQSQTQVECLAPDIVVIGVMRIAPIVRHVEIELQTIRQGEAEAGIHHQQRGIALVTLGVKIERVGGSQVLALVALPGEDAVVVGLISGSSPPCRTPSG